MPDPEGESQLVLLALAAGLCALFAFTLGRGSKPLAGRDSSSALAATQELVRQDCAALVIAMAELAQGNLAARLTVRATPIDAAAHPDMRGFVELLNSVIASLREAADVFNELTETPCQRLLYVGADSFVEGCACAEAMGKILGGAGQIAVVTTFFAVSGPELRRKGFLSALRENSPGVQVVTSLEGTESAEQAYERTRALLQRHPHLQGLYVTQGATPHDVARAVVDAGRAGQIKIVTHDLVDETMRDIQAGIITATLSQDPFAQGYETVMHLFNHVAAGWRPAAPRLLTRRELVTRENYVDFWDPVRGVIESAFAAGRRTHPMEPTSDRPLRIGVIGREDTKFWEPVRAGVLAAAERLRPYRATVEWVVPPVDGPAGTISAVSHCALLDSLAARGYDGIATAAFHRDYIASINRAVAAGVPVVTYNTEPSSLSGLVSIVKAQAGRLLDYSQDLAATINSVRQATHHITLAMSQISQGTASQTDQVGHTHEVLNSLLTQVDDVTREATQGASAAEVAAQAASAGDKAANLTRTSMQGIEEAVTETAETVEALGRKSEQIDTIIRLISSIAYQIKLLGINAAIEAAHAGQYGAGFLVVAGEIRSLAERTSRATVEITDLVGSVKGSVRDVQKVMGLALERVAQGAAMAEQAGKVLTDILRSVEGNRNRLTTITSTASKMQGFSREVGGAMESVAAVSEQNAASVEEVTASTEEMSGQLDEVNRLAQNLAAMAQTAREMLARFSVAGDPAVTSTEARRRVPTESPDGRETEERR
jgi:methyl-accepting chemotaxis protein